MCEDNKRVKELELEKEVLELQIKVLELQKELGVNPNKYNPPYIDPIPQPIPYPVYPYEPLYPYIPMQPIIRYVYSYKTTTTDKLVVEDDIKDNGDSTDIKK
jgi:hypothetical protein